MAAATIVVAVIVVNVWRPAPFLRGPGHLNCPEISVSDPLASTDELIAQFGAAAFTVYFPAVVQEERVAKWRGQVRYFVHDGPQYAKDYTRKLAVELSCLTGLYIYELDPGSDLRTGLSVHFFPPEKLVATTIHHDVEARNEARKSEATVGECRCYAQAALYVDRVDVPRTHLKGAMIIVSSDVDEQEARGCHTRTMIDSLGLIEAANEIDRSALRAEPPLVDELTSNDRILLRALYDDRLKNGMPREKAMEIVREIIPDLVKAVQPDGIRALYQN